MAARGPSSRRALPVALVLGAGCVAAGLALLWYSGRVAGGQFALRDQVPAAADQLLWVDSWGGAARGLRHLAARIRGAEGLVEAAAMLAGLEGLDPEQMREAGLVPGAGVAVFRFDGAVWGVTQVQGRRGADHILGVIARRGHAVIPLPPLDAGARWWGIASHGRGRAVRMHARLQGDVFALRWPLAEGEDDPGAAVKRWREAPRVAAEVFAERRGQLHARLTLDRELGVHAAMRKAMGPATLLFGRLVDRFERVRVDLDLDAERPGLRVALLTAPGGAKDVADYHQRFLSEDGGLLSLGELLPDEVALLLRARINPALLDMVPRFLRDRLVPASLLARVHPALAGLDARAALIDRLDGQVALGLLGLDDGVPPDPRTWLRRGLRRTVGGFVAVSLRTDEGARGLLERAQGLLEESGAKPTRVVLGVFSGFTVAAKPAPWTLVRRGRALVWISGQGELERFERAARGKFPTLGAVAVSPLERSVLQGRGQWVGALATTGRLVRSLRRRGVPDHFVSMVASVAGLCAVVALQDEGVSIEVELRPKAAPGGGTP